jgi:hypothetical protein
MGSLEPVMMFEDIQTTSRLATASCLSPVSRQQSADLLAA